MPVRSSANEEGETINRELLLQNAERASFKYGKVYLITSQIQ